MNLFADHSSGPTSSQKCSHRQTEIRRCLKPTASCRHQACTPPTLKGASTPREQSTLSIPNVRKAITLHGPLGHSPRGTRSTCEAFKTSARAGPRPDSLYLQRDPDVSHLSKGPRPFGSQSGGSSGESHGLAASKEKQIQKDHRLHGDLNSTATQGFRWVFRRHMSQADRAQKGQLRQLGQKSFP